MSRAAPSERCLMQVRVKNMTTSYKILECSMMMDNMTPGSQRDNDALKYFLTFETQQITKLHKYQSKCSIDHCVDVSCVKSFI